jgi:hypothetical protein
MATGFPDLLAAEWLKARTGRLGWLLALVGGFLVVVSNLGLLSQGVEQLDAGTTTLAELTDVPVRNSMAMLLPAALFGAVFVAREYTGGTIGRSALLSGGRDRQWAAKLLVSLAAGALFGLFALVLGAGSAWALLAGHGHAPLWTGETWLIALGVFTVNVLGAAWGVFLGWILRKDMVAVAALVLLVLGVEPALHRFVPEAGKYFLTVAMSSVYRDTQPDLLPIPFACLVIAAWLAAAGYLARRLVRSRDLT